MGELALNKSKGWVIERKFANGIFNQYNTEFSSYVNELNKTKNEQEKYTLTTWDYDRYNSLSCGNNESIDPPISYWCEHFENWFSKQPKEYSNVTIDYIKRNSTTFFNNETYKNYFQGMLDKYNEDYYRVDGFKWSINESKNIENTQNGDSVFSYVENCLNIKATCSQVNKYYKDNGYDLNNTQTCDWVANNIDFNTYNNTYNDKVNLEWYKNTCGCVSGPGESGDSYNCTPEYNLGSCITSDDIIYSDSSDGLVNDEYWNNCVFSDNGKYDISTHKTSKTSSHNYKDADLGSKYCEVYCIEDLYTNLSKNEYSLAGRFIDWVSGSFISGSRTCRTKNIDYKTFEEDLEDANDELVDAYLDYEEALTIDSTTPSVVEEGCYYDEYETGTYECNCRGGSCHSEQCGICNWDDYECLTKEEKCYSDGCVYTGRYRHYTGTSYYDLYVIKPFTTTIKVDGKAIKQEYNGAAWCSNSYSSIDDTSTYRKYNKGKPSTTAAKNAYRTAVSNLQSTIDSMKACYINVIE